MSRAPFLLAPLDGAHDRAKLHCDSEPLNRYLREQANQDIRRRVAACFVALADGQRIAGYYTLAFASLYLADLPASTIKKLPRYPTVPAVRMGRLAVIVNSRGKALAERCWPMRCTVPLALRWPPSLRSWKPRTRRQPLFTAIMVSSPCPTRR